MTDYPRSVIQRVGTGWTRFWFAPSDPIVLGLIRILTGLVALWWYLGLYTELQHWFAPNGLFSLDMMHQMRSDPDLNTERFAFSIAEWADTAAALWFVYSLGAIAILLMIAGI